MNDENLAQQLFLANLVSGPWAAGCARIVREALKALGAIHENPQLCDTAECCLSAIRAERLFLERVERTTVVAGVDIDLRPGIALAIKEIMRLEDDLHDTILRSHPQN